MARHELLGPFLASFEACAVSTGPYDEHSGTLLGEVVAQTGHERVFVADNNEVDSVGVDGACHGVEVGRLQSDVGAEGAGASVAGSYEEVSHTRALRHFPGQRRLAASRSEQKHIERTLALFGPGILSHKRIFFQFLLNERAWVNAVLYCHCRCRFNEVICRNYCRRRDVSSRGADA